METESGRQFVPLYFDVIGSQLYKQVSGNALKLYNMLRRYVCRARSGHSLSAFYIHGYLATSGFLGTYAKLFGKSESTISRWLKELEGHDIISTYRKGREGVPSIWILGRVLHVEGSEYGVDVFFLDHLATAQEEDPETAVAFDDAQMAECETPKHVKLNSTLALLQARVQARVQGSNREERIEKTNSKRLSKTAKPPLPEIPEDYTVTYHYKDRDHVKIVGKAATGPWSADCPNCHEPTIVTALDTAVQCFCGMHEIVVTRTKPKVQRVRYSEAVEAYYGIVRARGIKYGSMAEWHTEIDAHVTDVPRWRQVVKEYIANNGWSPTSVDRMLGYYVENRLPGTRKKTEKKDLTDAQTANMAKAPTQVVGKGKYVTTIVDGKARVQFVPEEG